MKVLADFGFKAFDHLQRVFEQVAFERAHIGGVQFVQVFIAGAETHGFQTGFQTDVHHIGEGFAHVFGQRLVQNAFVGQLVQAIKSIGFLQMRFEAERA